jgi:hypothetical protein
MSLKYNGNMRIKSATKTLMHEQESTFTGSVGMQEITSKDIAGKDFNPQDLEWSVSGTGIADNSEGAAQVDIKALLDVWKAKEQVTIEMTDDVSGNLAIAGAGYYESVTVKSTNKEKVTYDFSFKGILTPTFELNA